MELFKRKVDTTPKAIILRCASGKEFAIKTLLNATDFPQVSFFIPMVSEYREIRRRKAQGEVQVIMPAFSGYLFAVNALPCWKHLRDNRNVIDVLCYAHPTQHMLPYEVPQSQIDGNYFFDRTPDPTPQKPFAVGSKVRVQCGPFTGFEGVVVASRLVEIDMFGRKVKSKIPQNMLTLI